MFGLGAIQEFAHRATVYTKDLVASTFSARTAHVAGAGEHLEQDIPLSTFRVHREYNTSAESLTKDTPVAPSPQAPSPPASPQKTNYYVDTARPKKRHIMSEGSLLRDKTKPINPALPVPERGGQAKQLDEALPVGEAAAPAKKKMVWDLFKPAEKKKRAPRDDRGFPRAPPKAMKAKQSKPPTATVSKGAADDFLHLKKSSKGSSEGQEQLWQEFFQQRRSGDSSRASSVVDDADEPFNPNGWDNSLFENTRSSLS